MTTHTTLKRSLAAALLAVSAAAVGLPLAPAQGPVTFNEREVKSSGSLTDDPKSDTWTMDFRFKDPRLIKINVPGRGTRICWYLWYQVINRTKEPRTIYPEFELVTLDYPGVYLDEPLTTVEDAIKKIEDPTGYQDIKNSVTITAAPIPKSEAPDKGFPKAVTGVAIWDGTPADPKQRIERDLSDSQRFSIFISGLSNGWVRVDPLGKGKTDAPIIRRKTLQLNFKRSGDKYTLDARDITFEPPAEWIYRASRLARKQDLEPRKDGKDGKDGDKGKDGAQLSPLQDLNTLIQPVLHRGNEHGS